MFISVSEVNTKDHYFTRTKCRILIAFRSLGTVKHPQATMAKYFEVVDRQLLALASLLHDSNWLVFDATVGSASQLQYLC